jgi:hypothetical protein
MNEGERYDLRTFALMVMQMVHFDTVNLERVKKLYRREFGVLIGKDKSPTLGTMRRKLGELVQRVDTDRAMMGLARNYIDKLAPESRTFYIDDHFDPYWGKQEVLMGFSHVYDRAMEGTEHCFVHDSTGNPLFFRLRDCFHSFNQVLPYIAAELKALVGGEDRISLVFDRGGYDSKVFNRLGLMHINYSVWVKGDKTDYDSLNLEYNEEEFLFKGNSPDKPRRVMMGIAETSFEKGGRGGPTRKIVLRRNAGRRLRKKQKYMYSAFVTNGTEKGKGELTEDMILRWRQECDFKSETGEFGIDQITTYLMKGYREGAAEDIQDMPREEVEGRQVKNPELKPLQRRKRQIKTEIAKIDEELGRQTFSEYEADTRTVAEVSLKPGNAKLLRERKKLVTELAEVEKARKGLPKEVAMLDLLKERSIMRFDFRKKLLMNTLKVAARNVRRMALGVLDRHYSNYRDQVDFLRRLIRSGGHMKLRRDGTIVVTLSAMNMEWENRVANAFLNDVNSLKPVLLGGNPIPLEFRLAN